MVEIKEGLLYTDTHMWVKREEGNARIGLTDFGQTDLGEVVFVDLPEAGRNITRGDEFGALESVKTVESLFSPVSGTIVGSNTSVSKMPGTINERPYDEGWLLIVEMSDPSELDGMMDAAGYKDMCAGN